MSSIEKIAFLAKLAAARPGLWANIRAKKKRGETVAKPGDEDYPDSKNWDKVTAISEKKAQCWEGYERVPGTKALTSGSCRPKGKKKEDKSAAAWETSEGKNPEGGLNDKGRASLKAQGHDIKRPQPEGGARKDSFCARMGGMKAKLTSSETANDPDSRINKALRKWKCGSDMVEKQAIAAIFKALGQGALRAMSKAPMTTAAVGIGGAGAYEATRPTNKLIPQILPNTAVPTPPSPTEKTGWSLASLAKQAVAAQGGYQKTSGVLQAIGAAGQALGLKGLAKGVSTGIGSFRKPLTTLGNSVPEGILSAERNQALQAGNKFLSSFKPEGFNVYAGRVKTPSSIAGHGTEQATNDLLGFRLSSKQGYGQPAVDMLTKQLTDAGVNINSSKMLVRPGYHGHNIKGDLHGSPVEFQLSPRRLQGLNAADHSMVYKPHESGVNPTIGKMYAPLFQYGMNVASPMVPATTRLGYGAAGVGAVGAVGAGGYAATR